MLATGTRFTIANNLNISAAVEFLKSQAYGVEVAKY